MTALLRRLRYLSMVLSLCAVVTGCTRVDLAYRNLDVIIPWSLNDYLDMNREQKSWFDERLRDHLHWHCTTQLPGNLAWLQSIEQMVAEQQVTVEQLQARTREAKLAIAQVAAEVTPSAVQLLQGLDDRQVRALQQSFSEDLQDKRRKYVAPPLAEQVADRAKRMEKRLVPWFGSLDERQRQRVSSWSQSLGEQNREWIDNREHWQQQFMAALQQRGSADFPARIAQLLQRRESLWTPEYQQAYARTEQAGTQLLVDLVAYSSAAQRQRLSDKLAELRRDFAKLACLSGR